MKIKKSESEYETFCTFYNHKGKYLFTCVKDKTKKEYGFGATYFGAEYPSRLLIHFLYFRIEKLFFKKSGRFSN